MALDWRKLIGLRGPYPDSTGLGPDFPGSGSDRERGKFRPSEHPRLVTVAVSGDDGRPIMEGVQEEGSEQTLLLRAIVLGLSIMTETDLLNEVS